MNYFKNAHALLIGVGGYNMEETVNDATALHNILADKSLAGYKNIILLTEEQATRDGILKAFEKLINETNEDSSVLIYYSGHGVLKRKRVNTF